MDLTLRRPPGCQQKKLSGSDELITLRPVGSDQLPNEPRDKWSPLSFFELSNKSEKGMRVELDR